MVLVKLLEKLKFILEDFESCLGNKNEANQLGS